jgi:hypothetical protein
LGGWIAGQMVAEGASLGIAGIDSKSGGNGLAGKPMPRPELPRLKARWQN